MLLTNMTFTIAMFILFRICMCSGVKTVASTSDDITVQPSSAGLSSNNFQVFLMLTGDTGHKLSVNCFIFTIAAINEIVYLKVPESCNTEGKNSVKQATRLQTRFEITYDGSKHRKQNWLLDNGNNCTSYVLGTASNRFQVVAMHRVANITENDREVVYLQCRRQPNSSKRAFKQHVSFIGNVVLSAPLVVNWSLASTTYNASRRTPVVNPAYKEMAPCPCDLSVKVCDVNCCCDKDCRPTDLEHFQCMSGAFGGVREKKSLHYCNSASFFHPGWFPLLCIHEENNGFLGYFYTKVRSVELTRNAAYSYRVEYKPLVVESSRTKSQHVDLGSIADERMENDPIESLFGLPMVVGNTNSAYKPIPTIGYKISMPVVSGALTGGSVIDVSKRFSMVSSDVSGLCSKASSGVPQFAINKMGSCYVELKYNDFEDCGKLRKVIKDHLDRWMPASHISMVAVPDVGNLDDWIAVIRENVTATATESSDMQLSAVNVYRYDSATRQFQLRANATTQPLLTWSYMNEINGICSGIPTAIRLEVLFTESGRSDYFPIYTIVGAKIKYSVSTWKVQRTASKKQDRSGSQQFALITESRFTLSPLGAVRSRTEYGRQRSKTMHARAYYWEELFYPISTLNFGDSRQRTLGLSLVLLFVIVIGASIECTSKCKL